MSTQALRGTLEPLALLDVLAYLGRSSDTGTLTVEYEDVKKSLVIHDGKIVFARSNLTKDRLGDILLARGLINKEQYDEASRLIFEKRYRHGRALVEIGAISPKLLWEAIQQQIRTIALSIIPLERGHFEFVRQELKQKEHITLRLPILELLVEMIRTFPERGIFKSRFANLDEIYRKVENLDSEAFQLEPYEDYIFGFVDGHTSVRHICEGSDIGTEESLRVLYLLRCLAMIEFAGCADPSVIHHPLMIKYNEIFIFMGSYLSERVGSMGLSLLKKFFVQTEQTHDGIFSDVTIGKDGALDADKLQENFQNLDLPEHQKLQALEDALDEHLFSCILAVKKLLGPDHETSVLKFLEGVS